MKRRLNGGGVGNRLKWHASKIGRELSKGSAKENPRSRTNPEVIAIVLQHTTILNVHQYYNKPAYWCTHLPIQFHYEKHVNKPQEHPPPI